MLSALVLGATPTGLSHSAPVPVHTSSCVAGRRHTVRASYSTGANTFVDLDATEMAPQLSGVSCDKDHKKLELNFKRREDAHRWLANLGGRDNQFITGGEQWNCHSANVQSNIMLRVHSARESWFGLGSTLELRTSFATYDEVFESASIDFGTHSDEGCAADPSVTKHLCIGANSDCAGHSKAALPLYNSSSGTMKATCSDCMTDLISDVFAKFHFGGLLHPKESKITAGFANTTLDAHINLDLSASNTTTLALDKAVELVSKKYIVNFKVGPVPFQLYFDVPLHMLADLTLNGGVDVRMGANAVFSLGELSVSWDPTNHFNHSTPSLSHRITPSISAHAAAGAKGDLTLVPQFNLHFDRLLSASITAHPKLHSTLTGSSTTKKVCLSAQYALDLVAQAEVDFMSISEAWGPKTLGNWSGMPIPHACIHV